MADPLSVVASIAGLVQVSARIISIATQLYSSAKDAPTSINHIKVEMQQMHLIFLQVQKLMLGYERKMKRHKLSLLPLHHLLTILTGCVLAYSSLDKKLSEVAGLADGCTSDPEVNPATNQQAGSTTVAGSFVMRIKWALWKESEAAAVIANMQNHKSSLSIMLTIIQGDVALDDAERLAETLDNLRSAVEKISDTIAVTHGEAATQLRELVSKHHDGSSIPDCTSPENNVNDNYATSTNTTFSSTSTSISISTSSSLSDDSASIRTTATTVSVRSIRSLIIPFTEELKSSRAYKRISKGQRGRKWDSESLYSQDSRGSKGDRWSMLSDITLGDLSISELSVLELPIDSSVLYDPAPYQGHRPSPNLKQGRRRINLWASRGRLHEAIRMRNVFKLKTFLNLGVDIEELNADGQTPLEYAIFCGSEEMSQILMEAGAQFDPTREYKDGCTLLMDEVRAGSLEGCQKLLTMGVLADRRDSTDRTPLSYAAELAESSHLSICEVLVDIGASPDSSDRIGRTPLSYASGSPSSYSNNICELLVNKGAKVHLVDNSGRTPLSHAAGGSSVYSQNMCQLLLDKGAKAHSVDNSGRTPLSYAAGGSGVCGPQLCQLLLGKGAKAHSVDNSGRTPLSYAAGGSSVYSQNMCQLLLDKGAKAHSVDNSGRTPLSYATAGSSNYYNKDICQVLLDNGADAHSVDDSGRTPLSYAAGSSSVYSQDMCQLLLEKGAKAHSVDNSGRTPLSYAAGGPSGYSYRICQLLLDNGADAHSVDESGRTPLSYAAGNSRGSRHHIHLLLNKGADAHSVDNSGRTSLSYAAACCNTSVCEYLLLMGANVNAVDSSGKTSLDYVNRESHPKIYGLLLQNGAVSGSKQITS